MNNWRRYFIFYTFLFLLVLIIHLFLYGNAGDDAYIHFRIARNLLNYGKPYFNLDERVMSSSSTGWTITLFLLFWVFGVSIKAVACLNAIITTLTVFVYARIAQKLTGKNGIIYEIASGLVILPVTILPSIGLMETSAALLLAGIGLFLYLRKKSLSFLVLSRLVWVREAHSVPLLYVCWNLSFPATR